jgi:biotin carboxyl carrier protein
MMRSATEFSLILDGTPYKVSVEGNSILVNGQPFVVGFEGERVLVDSVPYEVTLEQDRVIVGGITYELGIEGLVEASAGPAAASTTVASEGAVTAIMPGKVIRVMVSEGDTIAEGEVVCILEAMKMENELKAPKAGTVTALHVQPGQDVEMGTVLAEIE